jgi:hypothetical protein
MAKRRHATPTPSRLKHPTEDLRRAELRAVERVMRLNRRIRQRTHQLTREAARASADLIDFAREVLERDGYTVVPARHAIEPEETAVS